MKWAFYHEKKHKKFYDTHPDLASKLIEKYANERLDDEIKYKNRFEPLIDVILTCTAIFFLLCAILGPIISLSYQILKYLKTGFWPSLSIIDIMKYFEINWATSPNDWFGLWQILNFLNFSILIFFFSFFILLGIYYKNTK
jgi:hypothetical protein